MFGMQFCASHKFTIHYMYVASRVAIDKRGKVSNWPMVAVTSHPYVYKFTLKNFVQVLIVQ